MMLDQTLNSAYPADQTISDACPVAPASSTEKDELARLRAEIDQHLEMQRELMRLLGTKQPNRILHDLRNLLQERIFLMAACKDSTGH